MVDAELQWQRRLELRSIQGSETTPTDRKVGEVWRSGFPFAYFVSFAADSVHQQTREQDVLQ